MRQITLIDGSNLARRNYHAQNLTTFTGIRTGCIYGSINSMLSLQSEQCANLVIMVWDVEGGSTYRKTMYPAYKAGRVGTDSEYFEDMNNLKELLGVMGVIQIEKPGVECDDIIGYLANVTFAEDKVTIVSTDKDFYQLINARVSQWNPYHQEYIPYVDGKVPIKEGQKTIRLHPSQVPDYKALVGDKSDNIPGASDFGIAAAMDYFALNTCIEPILQGKANISLIKNRPMQGLMQAIPFLAKFKEVATINITEGEVDVPDRPKVREDVVVALFEHYEFNQFKAMGTRVLAIGGIPWA